MITLVINTSLLREIDEHKIINFYAKLIYSDEEDVLNDNKIKDNLIKLFDWDKTGENGLGIYCGKFESIKRKDWDILIYFIKKNSDEIKRKAVPYLKNKKLQSDKLILNNIEQIEKHNKERFTNINYKVSGKGKKAKSCIYEGREYKSRQECMYKEGISQSKLYRYLEKTGQV